MKAVWYEGFGPPADQVLTYGEMPTPIRHRARFWCASMPLASTHRT